MAKETGTGRYIRLRAGKLWPHLFFSYVMVYVYTFRGSVKEIGKQLLIHIGESTPFSYFFFDLEYAGRYPLNYPSWYVTCLLICSIIIHYLYHNHKKCYVSVIAPVAVLLIYGHIYRNFSSLNIGGDVGLFLNEYLLRAFAGMSVGVISFCILDSLREIEFSRLFWILIRVAETVSMALFICLALQYGEQKTDMILLWILFAGTFCSFLHPAEHGTLYGAVHRIMKKVSIYTYACYLNHIFAGMLMKTISLYMPRWNRLFFYYMLILFLSVITQNLLWILERQGRKLKKVFVAG